MPDNILPPSPAKLEAWCLCYISLLHRVQLYTPASRIIRHAATATTQYGTCGPGVRDLNAGLAISVACGPCGKPMGVRPVKCEDGTAEGLEATWECTDCHPTAIL